jgi:hypothetical protein
MVLLVLIHGGTLMKELERIAALYAKKADEMRKLANHQAENYYNKACTRVALLITQN